MCVAAFVAHLVGCRQEAAPKSEPPAKVQVLPRETTLAQITLTADAFERLGITSANVMKESVERHVTIGGDVLVPNGKSIVVSAPVDGTIDAPEDGTLPLPGQWVEVGTRVARLVPLLSPERDVPTPAERVQIANSWATLLSALNVARGEISRSQAEVDAAKINLERAEQLLKDQAGSQKAVDDARALVNVHQAVLTAAQQREKELARLAEELEGSNSKHPDTAAPLSVTVPQSGVIRNLTITRGQTVNAGVALFEVADTATMWIRAPIYVGLLPEVQKDTAARVVELDGRPSFKPRSARPVEAPPTADRGQRHRRLVFRNRKRRQTVAAGTAGGRRIDASRRRAKFDRAG